MKILILAGGGGTRLFPLSTPEKPKQFIPLAEGKPLIVNTVNRFLGLVKQEDIIIVTGLKYKQLTEEILKEYGLNKVGLVYEPAARNTAPAIALGVKYINEKLKASESETIFVAPSDHVIRPTNTYLGYVKKAMDAAKKGGIVTIGIKPKSPDTGFGYIKAENKGVSFSKVLQFKEKPDLETAKGYLKSGDYYWNAGMFCFSAAGFETQLKAYCPGLFSLYSGSYAKFESKFESCEKISIDYAIMEKSSDVSVVPAEIEWSDIGGWDAYYDYCEKDSDGNVIIGDVQAVDCKGCLIYFDTTKLKLKIESQKGKIIIQADENLFIRNRKE